MHECLVNIVNIRTIPEGICYTSNNCRRLALSKMWIRVRVRVIGQWYLMLYGNRCWDGSGPVLANRLTRVQCILASPRQNLARSVAFYRTVSDGYTVPVRWTVRTAQCSLPMSVKVLCFSFTFPWKQLFPKLKMNKMSSHRKKKLGSWNNPPSLQNLADWEEPPPLTHISFEFLEICSDRRLWGRWFPHSLSKWVDSWFWMWWDLLYEEWNSTLLKEWCCLHS